MDTRAHIRADVLLALVLVSLGVAVHGVNRSLESSLGERISSGRIGALPDGKVIRVLSLGFDRLIADLFWIRTIYYVGDERLQELGYPDVDRLANLVTDIDPEFATAYVVMSGAISTLKRDPDAAIALLEKGVANADYWKLHFLLGFSYFIERLDYARAAVQMEIAARKGGPPYLPLLAARLYARAGDPETALAFIQARLHEEEDRTTREALERRYWDLWIARDLRRIDAAIDAYAKKRGRRPQTITELVTAGLLDGEPRDPRGGRYRIESGRAATDLQYEELDVHVPYRPSGPAGGSDAKEAAGR